MNGILGEDVDQYYVGATPDLMSDYKKADAKADSYIKEVFDDNIQKAKYEQIIDITRYFSLCKQHR